MKGETTPVFDISTRKQMNKVLKELMETFEILSVFRDDETVVYDYISIVTEERKAKNRLDMSDGDDITVEL